MVCVNSPDELCWAWLSVSGGEVVSASVVVVTTVGERPVSVTAIAREAKIRQASTNMLQNHSPFCFLGGFFLPF